MARARLGAATTAGLLALLAPALAHATEPVTARHLQVEMGFVVGGGDDEDLWGPGFGARVGYTLSTPVYFGVGFDAFPHESHQNEPRSFAVVLGQVGYDFGFGSEPQLVLRPTLGMGFAHLNKNRPENGFVVSPGIEAILSTAVLLSTSFRFDAVSLPSRAHQGFVVSFGIGFPF